MEISVTVLKATCLKVIEDVDRHHQEVIVTKRSKPVARIVPVEPGPPESVVGILAGSGRTVGDILAPAESWDIISSAFCLRPARKNGFVGHFS